MIIKNIKKLGLVLLFLGLIVPVFSFAEDIGPQCDSILASNAGCPNMTGPDCTAFLKRCNDYYDQQSVQLSQDLTKTSAQKNTLQSAIKKLKNKITSLNNDIKQGKIMVQGLNIQIVETQGSIVKTSAQIASSQDQIKAILRTINAEEKKPAFIILLEGNLSDFFSNLTYLDSLNSQVTNLLGNTKNLKSYLEGQEVKMNDSVDQLQKTIALQAAQKAENEQNQQEQNQYLKLTEAQYQKTLADKTAVEQKAAKIKAMLFQVVGISKAPTFGEALEVAKSAAGLVGIRPAFLLAIISQESAIGRNVGQCYLTDAVTGEGKKISSGVVMQRVMKPTRDVQPFISITTAVGRDPYKTPVSCPIVGVAGYGGAMGPAQFIPSTWNGLTDRLTSLLGKAPDPWAIRDSFTASGLYLADLGATKQTAAAENAAAGRYYGVAGSYNRSVMNKASCIQTFIDAGTMTTSCQNSIL
jgi:peptidoglycan hydrolase CwlO-like protein